MRTSILAGIAIASALGLSSSAPVVAQTDVDQQLGNVNFQTSCNVARSGKPDAAKANIGKLAELRDKLSEAKDSYWALAAFEATKAKEPNRFHGYAGAAQAAAR